MAEPEGTRGGKFYARRVLPKTEEMRLRVGVDMNIEIVVIQVSKVAFKAVAACKSALVLRRHFGTAFTSVMRPFAEPFRGPRVRFVGRRQVEMG